MEGTRIVKTKTAKQVGNTVVQQEDVATAPTMDKGEFELAKSNQLFWYIGHFVATLLALRFIFLLLGANLRGIVLVIYNVTNILISPFRGIFPPVRAGESFFDSAALLAIVMYYLLVIAITQGIRLFSKQVET